MANRKADELQISHAAPYQ